MRFRVVLAVALLVAAGRASAQASIPSFAELEAAGAVIGEIHVVAQDVFDLSDPAENNWLFRLANDLHVQTRPSVIRRQLLFHSGEPLVAQRIEETLRLLRGNSYLYAASIRAVAYRDGVVDLEVTTRDTWSLEFGAHASTAGGTNTGGLKLKEENLFGTGLKLGLSSQSQSEVSAAGGSRHTISADLSYPFALDGRTMLAYAQSRFTDGHSESLSAQRPFYALDARGAGGFSVSRDDRLLSRYADGAELGQFRRRSETGEIFGGWSAGLIDGWAQRYSAGLRFAHEANEADTIAPVSKDRVLYSPFLRYELVEDNFREVSNLESIGRPEYLALGLHATVEVSRSLRGLGSSEAVTRYAASLSRGIRFAEESTLLAQASLSGERAAGEDDRRTWSGNLRFYHRQRNHALLYLSLQADRTDYADGTQYLSLGGDTGLRGYPTNYKLGDHRVLFTAEQRLFSDWYPFRLVRVGGALFYDAGRAWGGPYAAPGPVHWHADAGFGLRLLSARSSSGTTVHIDFAFPIERDSAVDTYQITVKSRSSF